jgi:mRNA interferase MazF
MRVTRRWCGEPGEIWLVSLDPTVGSEIKKSRRCVVVSPPEMHDYLRTVIVAPMTTKSRPAPFRILVTHGGKRGLILLDQVRAVRTRFAWQRSWSSFGENAGSHPGDVAWWWVFAELIA